MLHHAHLQKSLWAEAIVTATYVQNRTPHATLHGMTPFEKLYGQVPDIGHLRIFGSTCFARKLGNNDKLDPNAVECILLGYTENTKRGYRLLKKSDNSTMVARDVKFHENSKQGDDDTDRITIEIEEEPSEQGNTEPAEPKIQKIPQGPDAATIQASGHNFRGGARVDYAISEDELYEESDPDDDVYDSFRRIRAILQRKQEFDMATSDE